MRGNKIFNAIRGRAPHWLVIVCCVAALSISTGMQCQQAGTGSIQGAVADSTGAFIENATVTATDVATQVKRISTTGANGLYSFPNIAIGTYTIDVVAQGFEHYSQSNIVLEVGSSIAVNIVMTVGRTDQKIEVQASGLALQTEDATFKQTIDQQTVTEMRGRLVASGQLDDQSIDTFLAHCADPAWWTQTIAFTAAAAHVRD